MRFRLDTDGMAVTSSDFGTVEVTENPVTGQFDIFIDGTTYAGVLRRCVTSATAERHNIALATTDPSILGGGFMLLKVKNQGTIAVLVLLPDGRRASGSAYLADNGSFVFQTVVSRTRGASSLVGEFNFADLTSTDVTGELRWVSDEQTNGLYLAAHDSVLAANGCRFERGVSPLPDGPVTVTYSSGDLIENVIVDTTATNGSLAPTGGLTSFRISGRSGTFVTKFNHPDLDRSRKGRGIFLPKSNSAWGYFSGVTEGGRIELIDAILPPG